MESIRDLKIDVLDDGFVRVVDMMGDDSSVVQAARISYGKGTKKVSEDRGLIRYLMRHRHSTPFEMCEIKLHVRVPMDCWRQWIRHRTANVNEYSTRYSEAIDSARSTSAGEWRSQSTTNRQGSEEYLPKSVGEVLSHDESELHDKIRETYQSRLREGVAREQARKDLSLSTYTEAYWKIDLHNLFHFLSLRMDSHAQSEIREYANVIGNAIVAEWVPICWEAFCDYRLGGIQLSRLEVDLIRKISQGETSLAIEAALEAGWFLSEPNKRSRECLEFESKASMLGFKAPWAKEEQ
ncbi:FAD-dependent thymidylate synthase [Roseiconus lacunae]|uniref:FAD-dependent thymidylate synthase n=1 Tax=Roseiconus lacunae TaxID=2605694 RepID=UPI001E58BBB5|nr:FAD-dependent thymidylate synthase [Roseiconus lacunae]MCD0462037.1 FAD-dependent thymidylate synthase [Roseiconus lacunae]